MFSDNFLPQMTETTKRNLFRSHTRENAFVRLMDYATQCCLMRYLVPLPGPNAMRDDRHGW